MRNTMILVGDIGGTKTLLALYQKEHDSFVLKSEASYPSAHYPSLTEIIDWFLSKQNNINIKAACFGVAGPVIDGCSQITNLDWFIEEKILAQHLNIDNVKLLNDLEIAAYGMLYLEENDFEKLNENALQNANRAVIAAGTGLGEAILYWDGKKYKVIPTEGGHCDFAPQTNEQDRLLQYLRQKYPDHVSNERVISGEGIINIYEFFKESEGIIENTEVKQAMQAAESKSAVISHYALSNQDPLCSKSLALFAYLYAQEAGNLVLKGLATGGLYITGGIAPKMLTLLKQPGFIQSFYAKGRFKVLLEKIAVQVALNPRAPLLGAAYQANAMLL